MSTLIRSAIIFLTHVRRKQIVEEYFASVSGEEEWAPPPSWAEFRAATLYQYQAGTDVR
jgi:hypothetical protein